MNNWQIATWLVVLLVNAYFIGRRFGYVRGRRDVYRETSPSHPEYTGPLERPKMDDPMACINRVKVGDGNPRLAREGR